MDLVYVGATLVLIAVLFGLVHACERLRGVGERR